MSWRRDLVRMGLRTARGQVVVRLRPDAAKAQRSFTVDPDWRRIEGDRAARLGPRETIDVADPVGRWAEVDPRLPTDGWARPWSVAGLLLWGGAVGAAWWLGASKGRGPLASLADEDDRA